MARHDPSGAEHKLRLRRRIDAAQGRIPCDLLLKNVRYLDVFACTFEQGDVGIIDGTIVGLEPGLMATRTIDARGDTLVPGFIDAHVHIESSLCTPDNFERMVLPRGTTAVIADPHEIANVTGLDGLRYFLDAATRTALDLNVMLSSCVPATDMETNGAGHIVAEELMRLAGHPHALGLAEMMNFPGVLSGDDEVLDKLVAFADRVIDGHCPLVTGQALSAYASAGVSSCHESSRLDEAREKLGKGIAVWIREGSVAKDVHTLAPLLTLATSTSVGFCTDDRNPADIAAQGHIDHLVRTAISLGVPMEVAYRAASWSVARHYGKRFVGAVAPGYRADLVLLGDAKTCAVREVFKDGRLVSELAWQSGGLTSAPNTVRAHVPELADLEGPRGSVHVIEVIPGKIITGRRVSAHDAAGVAKLTVLERHGKGMKPANGYVHGFGERLRGAIASSVGHDSHNLIAVGDRASDMQVALKALIGSGGGFCVVRDGEVLAHLPLPFAGLMSLASAGEIEKALHGLHAASKAIGCGLEEPFLQLAFLSLPVIPSLKLTDQGLVDVDAFRVIDVRAA